MAKNVYLDSSSIRAKVLSGVETLAKTVGSTLGPKGRTVILQTGPDKYITTKDGVTVAKAISVENDIENAAINLAKEASIKTNNDAGDGTTTATILQYALVKKALESGANVVDIVKGINVGVDLAEDYIKNHSNPADIERAHDIAYISSNGDVGIAEAVAAAFKEVGEDGVVLVEESGNLDTYVDIAEGTQLPAGYISPYLVNQEDSMKCIFEDAKIVITDKKITTSDLVPISNIVKLAGNSPILFVAEDFDPEVQTAFILNKLQGRCQVCAIKLSLYGEDRQTRANDLAVLTGGKLISETLGTKISEFTSKMFGSASKVIITSDKTIIIGGDGDEDEIEKLRTKLQTQLKETQKNTYEYNKIRSRITYLDGIVSVIRVGATTAAEMKEKRDRVDDAICAVRAALKGGYVAGGGTMYVRAANEIDEFLKTAPANSPIRLGVVILKESLYYPIETLFENAGMQNELRLVLINENMLNANMAYDIRVGEWDEALKIGVIDPTNVVIGALKNAAASASVLLMSNAIVCNKPEESKTPAMMPGMM